MLTVLRDQSLSSWGWRLPRIAVDLQGQRGNEDRDGQIGPSAECKASVLEALGQKKPTEPRQTERGDVGTTG